MKFFAVFAICRKGDLICATTREDGSTGLPGGKVDLGELPEVAVLREAKEEGFVFKNPILVHTDLVDGKPVAWFEVDFVCKLETYKEMYRNIKPIYATIDTVAKNFGNSFLQQ